LIDAMPIEIDIPSESIIKGDQKSISIACASIVAKTARDAYMVEMDK
jgi:ribonuclease HII